MKKRVFALLLALAVLVSFGLWFLVLIGVL